MSYLSQIEALLFVAGEEGLSVRNLATLLSLTPTALQQQLEKLSEKNRLRGIFARCSNREKLQRPGKKKSSHR